MKMPNVWVITLVVAAAGGVGYWRYRATRRPPEIQYKTTAIDHRHITGKVTASGTLSALVTVQVGTQVSGRIQKLFADFNSPVKKGQVVAKIDPQLFEAQLQQQQANYLSAQAQVAQATATATNNDRVLARDKALREQGLAAQADLDTAEANAATGHAGVDAAKAQLAQAAAQLHLAQVNLSYTTIISPIDGVVISRSVDTGQTVAASLSAPTLFTIAQDLTKMQVDTNVAEGDVGRLQLGMATYFTVDSFPGQRFNGKIREIRNAATTVQNVVTYDAVIDVNNADLKLRPGMTANITIIYADRPSALAVPNSALRFRPPPSIASAAAPAPSGSAPAPDGSSGAGGARAHGRGGKTAPQSEDGSEARTVWVLRGGTPQAITIHTALNDGTYTEVVDGDLKDGDLAIVDATSPDTAAPAPSSGAAGGSQSLRRLF
jgi:HlyD family secretion protein